MENKDYSLSLLRIALGLLFLIPGIGKLMAPEGVTQMLGGLGFPAPVVFAWILLLIEIIFGLALIIGFKTRFSVWPVFVVLLIATLLTALPKAYGDISNPQAAMSLLWHLVGLAGLLVINQKGPGKFL